MQPGANDNRPSARAPHLFLWRFERRSVTKRPSFQFYPTDWHGTRWISYDVGNCIFPRKPACYVIYLDGVLSYIGQASDLSKRMSSHEVRVGYGNSILTKWGPYKNVVVKARFSDRMGDWVMREVRLIHRIQPHLNCVGSVKKRGVV